MKSFKDLLGQELIIGASQPGTSTRDFPALLNSMTGAKIRLVSGYPGTREITLAIEKGEVQGLCGFSWSSLQAQRPDWLKSGFIRVLVQEHDKGHSALNKMGVPLAVDFAKSPENRRIMELIYSSETFGRPYMMPPGVPGVRVAALRRAFLDALRDKELLAGRDAAGAGGEDLRHARRHHRSGAAGGDVQGAVISTLHSPSPAAACTPSIAGEPPSRTA